MAGASFVISGYQRFVSDKSMLKKLYGEKTTSEDKQEIGEEADQQNFKDSPRAKFRESLEER